MKVFGNSKHSNPKDFHITVEDSNQKEELSVENEFEEETEEQQSRISSKGRSVMLFIGALCIFLCAVVMSMVLITKSADVEPLPVINNIKPMEYVVNMQQPEDAVVPVDFTAPESANGSPIINFLIVSVDDEESTMMMLASVNMTSKRVSLLSIPRDTYITGNYTEPKLRNVYSASEESGRGIQALKEKAREMIGFWPDYYLVLDEASVNQIFNLIGDIPFDVPSSPRYTDLDSGEQHIDSHSAMQLFSCRNNYTNVETDSTAVQRDLLIRMFSALFEQTDSAKENAELLSEVMDTDLNASQLAYMAFFLHDVEPESVISLVLPGEVIEVEEDGKDYFQVDLEEAARILNSYFNPLESELTIYDLNFRQLAGDSGVGEYEEYGFPDSNNNNNYTPTRPQETEEPEPTEPDPLPTETPPVTPPDPVDPIG